MDCSLVLLSNKSRGNITASFGDAVHTNASVRLQLKPCLKALNELNLPPQILSISSDTEYSIKSKNIPKICIVGKISSPDKDEMSNFAKANRALLRKLKELLVPIVIIYSDNKANKAFHGHGFIREILDMADHVICPTNHMCTLANKWTQKNTECSVILDPNQGFNEKIKRVNRHEKKIRLIWFGHESNLVYLLRVIPDIISTIIKSYELELTILSSKSALNTLSSYLSKTNTGSLTLRRIEWNHYDQPRQLHQELTRAHISLIPSDPQDPLKQGCSHNRLVDSLFGGCITIASPMPSYLELSKLSLLGNDFSYLIKYAFKNNERLCYKYDLLKPKYLKDFSHSKNSENWHKIIKKLVTD